MVDIIRARQEHYEGAERVLLHHLGGETAEETHVPVDDLLQDGSHPEGRVAIDKGQVVGIMGVYNYDDIEEMIEERISGRVRPSINSIPDSRAAFLAYAYVDKDRISEGIGSALLTELIEFSKKEYDADAAYAEAWIYDAEIDSRTLLRKYDFEPFFWPENYWPKDSTCSYHTNRECLCEGALFRKTL